jgi:hypothetical protein
MLRFYMLSNRGLFMHRNGQWLWFGDASCDWFYPSQRPSASEGFVRVSWWYAIGTVLHTASCPNNGFHKPFWALRRLLCVALTGKGETF